MRIHLLCDQKWRDLPNLVALKLKLQNIGYRVLLSTTKDAAPMLHSFRPDCVVFNHLFSPANQKMAAALRANGVAVVILPTEGAGRPETLSLTDGEFADFRHLDLHLAWSEPAAQGIRTRWGFDEIVVPVLGCTRLDFYTPPFRRAVTPREVFCRQHGLDPDRPIVTWATAHNFADIKKDPEVLGKFLREATDNGLAICYKRIGVDPRRLIGIHADDRAAAAEAFVKLTSARPEVQFILRPHPVESRDFYSALIAEHSLENVRFCPRDYIWNVLNASSVHLHRHCTTAIEAWMWDKPTIEMSMGPPSELVWPDREAGSDVATTPNALIATVDRYLAGAPVDAGRIAYRRQYIHTWFGPADGRRCAAAAETIHRMLRARGRRRTLLSPLNGIKATQRQVATAVARYALGRLPNEPLLRRVPRQKIDPTDKQITRRDVKAYMPLVSAAVQ